MRRWIADASPIILLAKIDQVHLLEQLPDVLVVPAPVAKEVRSGPKGDPARQWLEANGADYIEPIPSQVSEVNAWDLGRGESAVLSWAYNDSRATALVDDLAARCCARALGIRVTGTIGVVLAAKEEGLITRAGTVLDALVEVGLRIHPEVMAEAKRLAGEA
jgi:predicted nucleic acid-binding protein